jgi:hypothetical protein
VLQQIMPFFKKDIKLTESDAETIVNKTLAQLKSTLQKNNDDLFVTASGKGVITLSYIKSQVSETLRGDGMLLSKAITKKLQLTTDV